MSQTQDGSPECKRRPHTKQSQTCGALHRNRTQKHMPRKGVGEHAFLDRPSEMHRRRTPADAPPRPRPNPGPQPPARASARCLAHMGQQTYYAKPAQGRPPRRGRHEGRATNAKRHRSAHAAGLGSLGQRPAAPLSRDELASQRHARLLTREGASPLPKEGRFVESRTKQHTGIRRSATPHTWPGPHRRDRATN